MKSAASTISCAEAVTLRVRLVVVLAVWVRLVAGAGVAAEVTGAPIRTIHRTHLPNLLTRAKVMILDNPVTHPQGKRLHSLVRAADRCQLGARRRQALVARLVVAQQVAFRVWPVVHLGVR